MVSTAAQRDKFLRTLHAHSPKVVALSAFIEYCDAFIVTDPVIEPVSLPINLRTLFHPDNAGNVEKGKEEAATKLDVTNEQVKKLIEESTKQADSPIWHEMRLGRITASKVHAVLHTKKDKPAPSVIKMICTPTEDLSSVPAIQWGRKHERTAAKEYGDAMMKQHEEMEIKQTGLWLSKDHPFIGASPDAIVTCKCCGTGVVEIKCPT